MKGIKTWGAYKHVLKKWSPGVKRTATYDLGRIGVLGSLGTVTSICALNPTSGRVKPYTPKPEP